ncbi:MAG TPA: UDP-2,3-diacylglucosamine diphosphatase LpxI [Bryobacteraceae bacterium]|jgi:DUF1009 family protein|nr:UDP-2,3-diacylglucosamine diphosphatase LpxI [Bryobacteraceae bacterium]
MRYGMIAGNGRFPCLALEAARETGIELITIAIKEEAAPDIERFAPKCYWISLGELSRLIEILQAEGVREVMMCGQVKHSKLYSSIRPDWRLLKLLSSLREKSTDALIGGVAKALENEGIRLVDSTLLLKPLLAGDGTLTKRGLARDEERDIQYGRRIAAALSSLDIGQSVAVADRACVAVEAMEGTDAMLRRAAGLVNGRPLRLVKASRRRAHLLFDVPVAGPQTIAVMRETNTTALAVDAGRTLLLDRTEMLSAADAAGIAVVGFRVED